MADPFTALCCKCGTHRSTKSTRAWRRGDPNHSPSEVGSTRCVITRKCRTCNEMTPHAYLRQPDDPARDIAETCDQDRQRRNQQRITAAVSDLEALGIDVRFHSMDTELLVGSVMRGLDEDGHVLVLVDDDLSPSLKAGVLERALTILLERMDACIWYVEPARDGQPPVAMVALTTAPPAAAGK